MASPCVTVACRADCGVG